MVSLARWTGTSGFRFLLQFWYAREPVFWVPKGWLPYYVEWLLSFPKAPLGAVSVQLWWIACTSVVGLLGEVVVAVYYAVMTPEKEGGEKREEKRSEAGVKKEL